MILELFNNAILILALLLVQWFFVQLWAVDGVLSRIGFGLLFGAAAIAAMETAMTLVPGIIMDMRTVVLSVAALFCGPLVAAISALIAAAYRLWLGGSGAYIGVATIVLSVGVGLLFRHFYRQRLGWMPLAGVLGFALAVNLPVIGLFYFLPLDYLDQVIFGFAGPYIVFLVLVTVGVVLGFEQIEKLRNYNTLLKESERHYRGLFGSNVVAFVDLDMSRLWLQLEVFREAGIDDIDRHFEDHPLLVDELLAGVVILRANDAADAFLGEPRSGDQTGQLRQLFEADNSALFRKVIEVLWHGGPFLDTEARIRASDGRDKECFISIPLPVKEKQAQSVTLSFIDVSELRQTQYELLEERRRLSEFLWATNVGTWEWFVQTGETRFNERWADIIGYELEELEPTSVETWMKYLHPDDLEVCQRQLDKVFKRELEHYDCIARMRHKKGHWVWVLTRGRVAEWSADGKPLRMAGTHTDITEIQLAQQRAETLSSLRQTVLECQSVMLEEKDEARLLQRVVETLTLHRRYPLAWIGIPQFDAAKTVRPVARSGSAAAFLDQVEIRWSDDELGRGVTGEAIRSGEMQVARNIEWEQRFAPWLKTARKWHLRSSVASPLKVKGEVVAVLVITSDSEDRFDTDERNLILELSNNLSFVLEALRSSEVA